MYEFIRHLKLSNYCGLCSLGFADGADAPVCPPPAPPPPQRVGPGAGSLAGGGLPIAIRNAPVLSVTQHSHAGGIMGHRYACGPAPPCPSTKQAHAHTRIASTEEPHRHVCVGTIYKSGPQKIDLGPYLEQQAAGMHARLPLGVAPSFGRMQRGLLL